MTLGNFSKQVKLLVELELENSRSPEFQLLKPIAGVSPMPFLIRFECSIGALIAIPAIARIARIERDMYMMETLYGLNRICTEE